MDAQIIRTKISKDDLAKITQENYGEMVKVDVDIKREILAIGGEWHSEGDELLNNDGSSREDVWGVNFYPWSPPEKRIQYRALINLKPSMGHRDMEIQDKNIQQKIRIIIEKLLLAQNETLPIQS